MKIDLNYGAQAVPEGERSAQNTPATASSNSSASAGTIGGIEDQTHLSGALAQVQALTAQAAQLPEIREAKVQSLRQTVLSGQYNPGPENVAGAMLGYMTMEA
jgi:flagellar biosynthesis anti-sigma factor FlgM